MRGRVLSLMIAVAALLTVGVRTSSAGTGAEPVDLALTSKGALISKIQDASGQPVAGAMIQLRQAGEPIAASHSGLDGWFIFHAVQPGPYELSTPGWSNPVRIWPELAIPPAVRDPIAIILPAATVPVAATDELPTIELVADTGSQPRSRLSGPALQSPAQTRLRPETADPRPAPAGQQSSSVATPAPWPRSQSEYPPLQVLPVPPANDSAFDPFAIPQHNPVSMTQLPAESVPVPDVQTQPGESSGQPDATLSPNPSPDGSAGPAGQNPDGTYNPMAQDQMAPPLPPQASVPGPPPVITSSPYYQPGPTVGDVVTTTLGIAAITVGSVAIYKYDKYEDRVRRVVSP